LIQFENGPIIEGNANATTKGLQSKIFKILYNH